MTYAPRSQPRPLGRAQTAANDAHETWRLQTGRLLLDAIAAFEAGDMAEFLRLDAEAKALPEPPIFA